jgi:hypothetical protein
MPVLNFVYNIQQTAKNGWRRLQSKAHFDPMNAEIKTLLEEHSNSTGVCSLINHMRKTSTTYAQIIALGKKALPDILEYLRDTQGGMNIIMLLHDITGEHPYTPVVEDGFAKTHVPTAREAWLMWGRERKLIP